ncbi:hypothetical protein ACN27F_25885 [Solwaraspora sp. WMMB335]|uniref:hypothetical protein n=1 Tax=Solwaraspora sp. WMMB335 TaxID=3404118 RepID=UPI003B92F10C
MDDRENPSSGLGPRTAAGLAAGAIALYAADVLYLSYLEPAGGQRWQLQTSVVLGLTAGLCYALAGTPLLTNLLTPINRQAAGVGRVLWLIFVLATVASHTVFAPVLDTLDNAGLTSDAAWETTLSGTGPATETMLWAFQITAGLSLVGLAGTLLGLIVATLRADSTLPRWSLAFHPVVGLLVIEVGLRSFLFDDGAARAFLPFSTSHLVYFGVLAVILAVGPSHRESAPGRG